MTKEELAAECYQVISSLYYSLEEALEKSDGYVNAGVKENAIRVLDALTEISEGEDGPESLLPFEL